MTDNNVEGLFNKYIRFIVLIKNINIHFELFRSVQLKFCFKVEIFEFEKTPTSFRGR